MDTGAQRGVAWAFWARVEELRNRAGMSLIELQHASGVRRQTYSALRTTTRRPRRDIVLALAGAVTLDPNDAMQLAGFLPVDLDTVRRTITATSDLDPEQKASLLALIDVYETEDNRRDSPAAPKANRVRRNGLNLVRAAS